MNLTDIERLLTQPEGQFLERKSCYEYTQGKWRLRKARDVARDIAETLSAFANADEGTERKTGRDLNIIKRARIELPLIKVIDEAYRTISAHIKERQYLHDLFFVERFEYPTFAWQEAIINAVAHRDYSIQGLSIEVWMFDDRLEIRSPGLPPEPVTLNKLLRRERVHASRNPLIVRVLTDSGYMRETGEGIPRMFDVMEKNGLYPPEISIVAESLFCVTLKNQPMYTPEDMEWLEQFDGLNLNPDQKRMLLFARAHGDFFTNRDWQSVCEVDIYTASRDLKDMLRKGCIIHPDKGGRIYHIIYPEEGRKVEFPGEYSKIKEMLDERGYVTNQDIREILKVQRFTATRITKKLVDLGLLAAQGKGRGAKYIKKIINK